MESMAKREPKAGEAKDAALGSEYVDARTYLTRPKAGLFGTPRRKSEPQHGSNDSDFGVPDQKQD